MWSDTGGLSVSAMDRNICSLRFRYAFVYIHSESPFFMAHCVIRRYGDIPIVFSHHHSGKRKKMTKIDFLREQLARGDITHEQFVRMKDEIHNRQRDYVLIRQ
jgi:hypothetical protein